METVKYTVQEGNTLWGIANFFGADADEIISLNELKEPELIFPGQVILVPVSKPQPPRFYAVRPGDTLYGIASRYSLAVDDIVKLNGFANPNLIFPGQIISLRA
ncbi:MAG: LysM peptidoglycan-binding domain-containing protein [Ruminococcus sp.]|nr:LysM peptidoglycan-binding domain-containing protein [Ruminococcus sp.]